MLGIANSGTIPSVWHVGRLLGVEAGGGLILGIALAFPVSRMMRAVNAYHVEILLTLSLALGGYALADYLRLSAPLEAVAAGLTLRWKNSHHPIDISHSEIEHFWTAIDEVQNAVLFVLMGCECLIVRFNLASIGLGMISIVFVDIIRFLIVSVLLAVVRLVQPGHRSSTSVIAWGGLRGGLSIALALSVPDRFGRDWILAATYTVVVFSIVVKGGSMDLFLKRFRASTASTD
jgi:CPA1 family monovalent cation:H+ antiporter